MKGIVTVEEDLYVVEERKMQPAPKIPKALIQLRVEIEKMERCIEDGDWEMMRKITNQRWRIYMKNLRKHKRRMEHRRTILT